MKIYSFKNGYSLLELIIYISIFSIVAVLAVNATLSITRVFADIKSYNDLRSSGLVSIDRIEKEIRFANNIDYVNSILNVNPGKLSLNSTDENGNAKTILFATSSGSLNLTENGVDKGSLTGANVTITNFIFRQSTTTKGILVKIELTLMDNRPTNARSANFYGSAVMRGSY